MTAQFLDRVIVTYRIGDPNGAYPIFSADGSRVRPGRWNTANSPLIYTSENYSLALLEKLAYANGVFPQNQYFVEVTLPNLVSYDDFDPYSHPGWDSDPPTISRQYGEAWQQSAQSLLLRVPSVIARREYNWLINPTHPEFNQVRPSIHTRVYWNSRLFGTPSP